MELLKLSQNDKMRKSGKIHGVRILNWSLPAWKSANGFTVCPFAGACRQGCYASQGRYQMPNVKDSQERNLDATKREDFISRMVATIQARKPDYLRIHDSGDFYSPKYLNDWFVIAAALPKVKFYAYTKSVKLVKDQVNLIPANMTIVFSTGSTRDDLIDRKKDRYSIIFRKGDPCPKGFVDASHDDLQIFKGRKIALEYHGFEKREFATK